MKVLFLTNIPSPYRVDFFNELGKKCELTVLFESTTAKDRDKNWVAREFTNFQAIFMKGIKFGQAEAFCPEVIKYVVDKKYDIIVVGMYSSPTSMLAIMIMKILGISYVLNSDGGFIKEDGFIKKKIKNFFIGGAKSWLSTGKLTAEYLCYYGARRDKIFNYPFSSVKKEDILLKPINSIQKKMIKEELGILEEKMVLSVGQFIYRKGYDLLLKSCKDLRKDIGIYIIGGKATKEYINILSDFGITNVHFLDFIPKEELSSYYCAADLFVLPTREDIWGLVINEAISYGLPVMTTNKCIAGVEMICGNGYIFEVDTNWGENMNRFFEEVDTTVLCNKSIDIALKYSIENMADAHIEIFRSQE